MSLIRVIFIFIFILSFSSAALGASKKKYVQLDNSAVLKEETPSYAATAYLEYLVGYEAELNGKWEDALRHYSNALKLDPSSAYLKTQINYMLVRLGKIKEALSGLEEVSDKHPDYAPALMLLGELYNSQKRIDDAIRVYERILTIGASEANRASLLLGVLYAAKGDFQKAIATLENLLKKEPENIMAMYYIASINIDRKEYEKAEEKFKKILEINPAFDAAYLNLGLINEAKGNISVAEEYYKKAIEINPNNLFVREKLMQLYITEKSFDKVIKELEKISGEMPKNIEVHQRLGLLYLQEKQYDKALSEFRIVLEARPDDIASRYYLSMVLTDMKRYDEAIEELKKIISTDPKNINVFVNMAFIYSRQGRHVDAAKVYEEILSFDKSKSEIYGYLGNEYIQLKDYKKAENILKEGLGQFKDSEELHFNIAVLYEKTDRFDDMVYHLKHTIELNPKHADAMNYLGYSYADKGINLQEALSLIENALKLKPDSGYIIDSLGWVYFKLGRLDDAVKTIRKALEYIKDDPVIHEHLGDIYNALGNYKDAIDEWNEALKFHGKEEGLKERVEKKIESAKRRMSESVK
ncbi:MAG: tetratricopeptide repeat protein [Thermodesulfovibrionales bacterium]|nr:tetratricopeptide repeat protein [Thermodesulfovibrionales bacterium]